MAKLESGDSNDANFLQFWEMFFCIQTSQSIQATDRGKLELAGGINSPHNGEDMRFMNEARWILEP